MSKIKKGAKISILLAMCIGMVLGTAKADTSGAFPDVPVNASYAEAVAVLSELGIFQGDNLGNFNPDKTISRAEAATVICRLLGVEDDAKRMTKVVFSDVPATHWAVGYVAKASELGIINGYGNGKFGPSDPVTQEQMIKMLVASFGLTDIAESLGGYPNGYLKTAEMYQITNGTVVDQKSAAKRSMIAVWSYNAMYA